MGEKRISRRAILKAAAASVLLMGCPGGRGGDPPALRPKPDPEPRPEKPVIVAAPPSKHEIAEVAHTERFIRQLDKWAEELVVSDVMPVRSQVIHGLGLPFHNPETESAMFLLDMSFGTMAIRDGSNVSGKLLDWDDVKSQNMMAELLQQVIASRINGYNGPNIVDIHDYFEKISRTSRYQAMVERMTMLRGYSEALETLSYSKDLQDHDLNKYQELAVEHCNENGDRRGLQLVKKYMELIRRKKAILSEDFTYFNQRDADERKREAAGIISDMVTVLKEIGAWEESLPKGSASPMIERMIEAMKETANQVEGEILGTPVGEVKFRTLPNVLNDTREMFANYGVSLVTARMNPWLFYPVLKNDDLEFFGSFSYRDVPLFGKPVGRYRLGQDISSAGFGSPELPKQLMYAVEVGWRGKKLMFPESDYTIKNGERWGHQFKKD